MIYSNLVSRIDGRCDMNGVPRCSLDGDMATELIASVQVKQNGTGYDRHSSDTRRPPYCVIPAP